MTPPEITYSQKVDEILEVAETLKTDWDFTFIDNLPDWTGEYTDAQKKQIDRIYEYVCDSPY